jgi:DNA-binding transcriptional ArsR family regulator
LHSPLRRSRNRTTSDAFNAAAKPQRRQILNLLAQGERSVNDVARLPRFKQPQVFKHLWVLREVGLVSVRGSGQQSLAERQGADVGWAETLDRRR